MKREGRESKRERYRKYEGGRKKRSTKKTEAEKARGNVCREKARKRKGRGEEREEGA